MGLNIDDLKKKFSGEIILPGDEQYETASTTFVSKGSPALVVRPDNPTDITAAILFAHDNKLEISIRSGGHSGQGYSTNKDGIVIDLNRMKKVEVIDSKKRVVRIQTGALWGEVAAVLQPLGLAISSGDTLSVGVGGISTGGGIGWMVRKYGLTIDNIIAAEVVIADGRVLHASEQENADLFWGLRGAGSNFGVVASIDVVAQPVSQVYAGVIQYGLEDVAGLVKGWRDCMRSVGDELTTIVNILPSFMGNPPMAMVMCCYASDDEVAAKQAIEPLLKLGKVVRQDLALKPYSEVLQEAHPPQGVKIVVNDGFVDDFNDDLIAAIASLYTPTSGPVLQIRSLGGAMNAVPVDSTAFAYRSSEALIVSPSFIPPNADKTAEANILKSWDMIKPFTNGMYGNLLGNIEVDITDVYPGATYERLLQIKKTYDPENVFKHNFNIHD